MRRGNWSFPLLFGYQVAQAAAQAVELPDNERVAVLQGLEAAEEAGAVRRGSRYALILENGFGFASGPRQGRKLQGRALVVGRYAGVAVFHSLILQQTFETRKLLILRNLRIVSKVTLCDTLETQANIEALLLLRLDLPLRRDCLFLLLFWLHLRRVGTAVRNIMPQRRAQLLAVVGEDLRVVCAAGRQRRPYGC